MRFPLGCEPRNSCLPLTSVVRSCNRTACRHFIAFAFISHLDFELEGGQGESGPGRDEAGSAWGWHADLSETIADRAKHARPLSGPRRASAAAGNEWPPFRAGRCAERRCGRRSPAPSARAGSRTSATQGPHDRARVAAAQCGAERKGAAEVGARVAHGAESFRPRARADRRPAGGRGRRAAARGHGATVRCTAAAPAAPAPSVVT